MTKPNMWIRALAFSFPFLILIFFLGNILKSSEIYLGDKIEKCNIVDGHIRIICYKNFLEGELKNANDSINHLIEKWLPYVKYNTLTQANLLYQSSHGPNCHTFMHALGDVIGNRYLDNPSEGLAICANDVCSGCRMSAITRMAYSYNYDESKIDQLINICLNQTYEFLCMHGAGHIFFDKYIFNITELYDMLEEGSYQSTLNNSFWAIRNMSLAFEACDKFTRERLVCYLGIAHNIYHYLHFAGHEWDKGIEWCNQVEKYKEICLKSFVFILGGSEAGPQLIKGNTNGSISFCTNLVQLLGEDIGKGCFKGIGLEIMGVASSLNVDKPSKLRREFEYLASLCKETGKYSDDCYNEMKDYIKRDINNLWIKEFKIYLSENLGKKYGF